MHDRVLVADGIDLPGFPAEIEWKSKNLSKLLNTYRITEERRLERLEQEHVGALVEDDSDNYDEARRGFRRGSKVVDEEWVDANQHGTFTFRATVDDTRWRYEARFTDGDLDGFVRLAPCDD